MQQTGIFAGRTEVRCPYARWGWTRGGGKVWHGGLDLAGLDDATIRMPYYKGKRITGRVTRARIVTDKRDKTWEWGYYVCVQLDRGQTPDAVNFLYFAHCASLLVKAGQRVASGDALAVMGNTGNAALADPPYRHCHLEVRAAAGGVGLDPTVYAGCENAVGVYGAAGRMQVITVGPVTQGRCGRGFGSLPGPRAGGCRTVQKRMEGCLMEKRNLFVSGKAVVAAVCGAFTAAFGWLGWLVVAWAACMALDWVSGSAAAASRGAWSSAAARAGIWHKAGMVVVVLVCALTDAVLAVAVANLPGLGLEVNGVVLPVVLVWYIFTELGSIAENAAAMGAPVPGWLVRILAQGKEGAEK